MLVILKMKMKIACLMLMQDRNLMIVHLVRLNLIYVLEKQECIF